MARNFDIAELLATSKTYINAPTEKQIYIVGSCLIGTVITWKSLKFLSRCGKSENVVLKGCHKVLRKFLNCGYIMRWTDFNYPTDLTICNYGSYGIYPRPVMEYQRAVVEQREKSTDDWYRHKVWAKWQEALNIIAQSVGAKSENIVLIKNVTEGVHCVMTWLGLTEKDAVLISNQQYAAIANGANYYCDKANAEVVTAEIKFPIKTEDEIIDLYEDMLKKHTNIRLVLLDHISSSSALLMPIKRLIELCHQYGKLVLIDGAHGPGQVELDLEMLGADFYAGNTYKWFYTPRPSGFLWVRPSFQKTMDPTLVSHFYKKGFHERFYKQGVSDYSAALTASYAIGTYYPSIGGMEHLHWYNTSLLNWAVDMMTKAWGTERLQIPDSMKAPFMAVVKIPPIYQKFYPPDATGAADLMKELADIHRVIIMPVIIQGELMFRVSTQLCAVKSDYRRAASIVSKRAAELEKLNTSA